MAESGGQAPSVGVVVTAGQPDLELFAASELCRYLSDLFGVDADPSEETEGFSDGLFLIGSPATNPAVAEATGGGSFPDVSDQGIVIRRCKFRGGDALVVGGGSPRAALWAVYELVERWGVRYLLHGDVLPERRAFELPDLTTVMEPNLTIRQWRVVNDFACGPESWGIEDYKPVIDQLAKLKFNRVYAFIWPYHPFVHYEVRGVKRNSGTLWFGDRYPVDDDTVGKEVFGEVEEFWNPDLPLGASYEETAAAGQRHIHSLFGYAASRGMECVIHTSTTEFPSEFAGLLKNARETHQLGTSTIVPGDGVAMDDDALTDLASAVIRATVNIYPEAGYISFVMQEHRQWIEEYERAWQALDEKYGVEEVCSLESVLASAAERDMPSGSYPGGEPRPVLEVKGDIVSLYFLDRLIDDLDVLADTARPDIKVVFESVVRELFPVLNVIAKPGWQAHVSTDYFPSSSALHDSIGKAPQLDLAGGGHPDAPRRQRGDIAPEHAGQLAPHYAANTRPGLVGVQHAVLADRRSRSHCFVHCKGRVGYCGLAGRRLPLRVEGGLRRRRRGGHVRDASRSPAGDRHTRAECVYHRLSRPEHDYEELDRQTLSARARGSAGGVPERPGFRAEGEEGGGERRGIYRLLDRPARLRN